jgi:hypothetical protein
MRTIKGVMEKAVSADKNGDNYEDWLDHEDIQCLLDTIKLYKDGLKSIQHYTSDKKCAYCSQVYEFSRRTLLGEKIENKYTNPK